ncbi:hypothetical protein HGI15_03710 [Modestobacter lapidis]|nr:hypothetical protein [Modestobacter lapidis]
MATGNDEGEPGEHRDGGPLDPDEKQVLEELATPAAGPAQAAVEDSPAAAAAADDDAPLPTAGIPGGDPGDELTPEFTDR